MPFDPSVGTLLLTALDPNVGPDRHASPSPHSQITDWDEVVSAAFIHGVSTYVYEAYRDAPGVPIDSLASLKSLRDRNALTHLRSVYDVRYLAEVLDTAGVEWLVVKGPTLAGPVHGSPERRGYGDLDVLVRASQLGQAMQLLRAAGSRIVDRNWELIHDQMKGEVHVQLPSGTHLDLHWHLLNEPERRAAFPIDLDGLFARSVQVDTGGAIVRGLGPVDNAVYIALHTIHSGGHRLIWLKDVERLLAQDVLDPSEIAARAAQWNATLVLRTALQRTESALGTLPSADALRRLLPPARAWSFVTARAWAAAPAAQEDGSGSVGRIVARSVRGSQGASFRDLTGRVLDHVRQHRRLSLDDSGPRRFAPDDPRSDRFPSGGEETKAAYLRAVAAWHVGG